RRDRPRRYDRRWSRALDLQLCGDAVELAAPSVSAPGQPALHARREDFLGDVVLEPLDRRSDRAVVAQRDTVRDIEPRFLAQIVEFVRELARQSLGLEFGRERGVERDDETRLARHGVAVLALMLHEHLRRLQLQPL